MSSSDDEKVARRPARGVGTDGGDVLAEIRAEVVAALSKAMREVQTVWSARGEAEDFKDLADEMIVVEDPFDIPLTVGRAVDAIEEDE